MSTFGQRVIHFHQNLNYKKKLPKDIKILNPFQDTPIINDALEAFYLKFFNDNRPRYLLAGINPGRFGAGQTGIPFTDTKRLSQQCGINIDAFESHEPSSVFIYEMIEAFGGVQAFYNRFYINSVCPLGFIQKNKKGNWVNCNYYDYQELFELMKPFIISTLKEQISFGIDTSICFSLGKKNAKFLSNINKEEHLFDKIVALPHPRYVMQYKFKEKEEFVSKYTTALQET